MKYQVTLHRYVPQMITIEVEAENDFIARARALRIAREQLVSGEDITGIIESTQPFRLLESSLVLTPIPEDSSVQSMGLDESSNRGFSHELRPDLL